MSSTSSSNVLLVGMSGSAGSFILPAFAKHKNSFSSISILSRSSSTQTFPKQENLGFKVIKADYSSHSSLVAALKGIDVVVSGVGLEGIEWQIQLADAAAEVGVKRFYPSEYGSDFTIEALKNEPVLAGKLKVRKYLEQLAAEGKLNYTFFVTGPWADWGIANGFLGFNVKKQKVTLYDEGSHLVSWSTERDIGEALVASLLKPELGRNKSIKIESFRATQSDILRTFEAESGSKWTIENTTTAKARALSQTAFARGDIPTGVVNGILSFIYDGRAVNEPLDNDKLAVKTKTLNEVVKELLASDAQNK